jgi:hypothetical protein
MMGECFWMQGRIGLAMEQYDAALSISVQCSKWTSMLVTKANGKTESRSREIDWGGETRRGAEFWIPSELAQIPLGGSDVRFSKLQPNPMQRGAWLLLMQWKYCDVKLSRFVGATIC